MIRREPKETPIPRRPRPVPVTWRFSDWAAI